MKKKGSINRNRLRRLKIGRASVVFFSGLRLSLSLRPTLCVISTSGRLHGEFLRLLYIIARRTKNWFSRHGNDERRTTKTPRLPSLGFL